MLLTRALAYFHQYGYSWTLSVDLARTDLRLEKINYRLIREVV